MRYAAIGLLLIFGAGVAYGQQQTCQVIGNRAFCSDSLLLVGTSVQDATVDRQSDAEFAYLHKIQLTEARAKRGELSSQEAQVRAFSSEAMARSYVEKTLRHNFSTVEQHKPPRNSPIHGGSITL